MILVVISWLFSIGGILGFGTMLLHSLLFNEDKETIFVFVGGLTVAYFLEFFLVNLMNAYSYQLLPFEIINIPLVIPCGWVVTFYGLNYMTRDLIELWELPQDEWIIIVMSGVLAILFGLGIEIVARSIEFWDFHFSAIKLFGVPIIVALAWGLSVMNFTLGLVLYEMNSQYWFLILILVLGLNLIVAVILLMI